MTRAGAEPSILTLNGGSSSIRFGLYARSEPPELRLRGKIDRIGQAGATLSFSEADTAESGEVGLDGSDHGAAVTQLIDWFEQRDIFAGIDAIGHRVVHGLLHAEPVYITSDLRTELERLRPRDPEHMPRELELIEAFGKRLPDCPQIACFDTAFHRHMPRVATQIALPRRFEALGIQRYGFHGLSYAYLIEELARLGDPAATRGRVILAHLGSGASLAAVRDGRSIDTSMGFTPASGLPMGTRTGDIDPGLVRFLADEQAMTPTQFDQLVNHESGLLGLSETSSDIRDLLASEADDPRAVEAIDLFCYQAKKTIGAYAAALGGLDTLVFAGGIGENAPAIRARICDRLDFLGITLDSVQNEAGTALISHSSARVAVRVIATDEEQMIATLVCRVLSSA
ncbi:MAG: acetate/propionate family kinase [Salinisphaera sp.]|jgi:acetate kinase|nr:acetate/propionate family kinase [Salinisphaera sp.]